MKMMNLTLCNFLVFSLCLLTTIGISEAEEYGSSSHALSQGSSVAENQYEAVGNVSGCTATLVEDNLVLTAAHCVCPNDSSTEGCSTRSTFTLRSVFPIDNPDTQEDESKKRIDISIGGNVRVHPEFGQRGWLREDLAVIHLDQPASTVAPKVVPIRIAKPQNTPMAGETLTLVGFGRTGKNCNNPSLGKQKLALKVTGSGFGGIKFRYDGLHACGGDSGGPVLNSDGNVVGAASWSNSSNESTYRPTSFSYNWIFDIPRPNWGSSSWIGVETKGVNSHHPGEAWCPKGSFITAIDLDGDRSMSAHDAPVIGQVLCTKLSGAESNGWAASSWVKVEQQGVNSHHPGEAWCPDGSFITQIDLDGDRSISANDSPVIGQVRCSKLAGNQYKRWGSSYWVAIGDKGIHSHQRRGPWCLDGAFLTQFDLDGHRSLADHYAPVIGRAKCSRPRP